MPKYKKTKLYYYQLRPNHFPSSENEKIEETKNAFRTAFESIGNAKTLSQGDGSVSATATKELHKRYWAGSLIYTQESNIPPKYNNTSKQMEAINIAGFSGLGYDSVFFYDEKNMILCIESKVPGPTLESMRKLLNESNTIPSFEYIPVTSQNEYNKFINSKGVRNIAIKMLNLDNLNDNKDTQKSIREIKDLVDDTNGSYIDIKIATGTDRTKFLNFKRVKSMVDYALSSIGTKHEITKFKVDIIDLDSGKIDAVDLITNRICDEISIEKEKTISKFSIQEKISQIEGLYLKRRPLLDKSYKL